MHWRIGWPDRQRYQCPIPKQTMDCHSGCLLSACDYDHVYDYVYGYVYDYVCGYVCVFGYVFVYNCPWFGWFAR